MGFRYSGEKRFFFWPNSLKHRGNLEFAPCEVKNPAYIYFIDGISHEERKLGRRKRGVVRRVWGRVSATPKEIYRTNKPGFFILSVLVIAMLASMVYLLYSRTARFVVTVERITRKEFIDLFTKATLEVYCREFQADCTNREKDEVEKDIRLTLLKILLPAKTTDARITYTNDTKTSIRITRFLYRTAPGPWKVEDPQRYYSPKLQRLRFAIEMANGNAPLETKVDYANTLALTENHGAITVLPGERKAWRLGYNERSEFLVEYMRDGKLYRTPVLKPE